MLSRTPIEFQVAAGFVTTVLACATVALAVPVAATSARVACVALAVCAYSAWARSPIAALTTAFIAWFFTTGFLVNTLGQLTVDGRDAIHLGALAAGALAGTLLRPRPTHPTPHTAPAPALPLDQAPATPRP